MMKLDTTFLDKYNVAVPRYTSYPPANYFKELSGDEAYRSALITSNGDHPQNISFYIHIPFCKKICFYCGCNACSLGSGSQVGPYVNALKKEISMLAESIDKVRKVSQIHYGGGTPNAIPVSMLKEINELLFSTFDFIDQAEIAIECNPAYLTREDVGDLLSAGFNRFSLGIQDFDKKVLKNVNREPSLLAVNELMGLIRSGKQDVGINLDFIYGLPGQSVESFVKTIKKAIELRPDRLVTFSYAHVPWMKKHQQILEKQGLPSAEEKMNMFLAGYELLSEAGYKSIGFDHYVLEKDELYQSLSELQLHRNFQGYCTRRTTGQVYAVGVSGISQLEKGYFQNEKEIEPYIASINKEEYPVVKGLILSEDEQIIRRVINELMCNKYLHWEKLSKQSGVNVQALKSLLSFKDEQFREFESDGLVSMTQASISVTEKGSLFIRNIAAALDPAYQEKLFNYSKSV